MNAVRLPTDGATLPAAIGAPMSDDRAEAAAHPAKAWPRVPAPAVAASRLCDDAYEVTLAGELDLHDAPALQRAFDDAEAAGVRRVLVDLASVPFVDSTVLGVLVRASRRFPCVVLAVGDLRVLRVLEITGLDRKLRVEHSRAEAVAALSAEAAA